MKSRLLHFFFTQESSFPGIFVRLGIMFFLTVQLTQSVYAQDDDEGIESIHGFTAEYADAPTSNRCLGSTFLIRVTISSIANYPGDNKFIAQLSDANGNFVNLNNYPAVSTNVIGVTQGHDYHYTYYITCLIPPSLVTGSNYAVRVGTYTQFDSFGGPNHVVFFQEPLHSFSLTSSSSPDLTISTSGGRRSGNNLFICSGLTALISVPSATGLSYQWFKDSQSIQGQTLPSLTVNSPGSYRVIVTNSCGVEFPSVTITVYVTTPTLPTVTASGSTTICQGESVRLNASGGEGTYTWYRVGSSNPVGSGSSLIVTTDGQYSVTTTNECGNLSSLPVRVTVNPLPSPTVVVNGSTTFCLNSISRPTLTASAGNYSYVWTNGTQNVGTSQSLQPTTSGSYTVTLTDNTTGCMNRSSPIIITAMSLPIVSINAPGGSIMCENGSVILQGTISSNYTSLEWLRTGAIVATNITSYAATSIGSYSLRAINSCGSQTSNVIQVEEVVIPPGQVTPSGTITLCPLETTTLTAPAGDYRYAWFKQGSVFSISQKRQLRVTTSGVYYVTLTTTTVPYCSRTLPPVSVVTESLPPLPNIEVVAPYAKCTAKLQATPNAGYSFQWYFNNSAIAGATGSSLTGSSTGNYYVMISNLCGSNVSNVISLNPPSSCLIAPKPIWGLGTLTIDPNGELDKTKMGTSTEDEIVIFPNPSPGELSIAITGVDKMIVPVTIFSKDMMLVHIENLELKEGIDTYRLSTKLKTGFYILSLQLNGRAVQRKIQIE